MRRRDLLRVLLTVAVAPVLLTRGTDRAAAQESAPASEADGPPAQPMLPSGAAPSTESSPVSAPTEAPSGTTPAAPVPVVQVAPLPGPIAQGPIPNNIVGLNVARLHQPNYIWATSDVVNANGGDWGYITVVWTIQDREDRMAEYNLQLFLDRCYEFHVQPIVRVATKFEAKREPTVPGQPAVKPNLQGAEGSWTRPDWDEPLKWRAFFERGKWPTRHAWIVIGNEPNLGREWGGAVDAAGYAKYLDHVLDVFADAPRFDIVSGALDISNTTAMPVMQDALEFLDEMGATVPGLFERLPAWASNPYHVPNLGPGVRYTHRAYEAELDRIGREMPVLITEAGNLQTGDELEIARFYAEAFRDWMADPKVVAATPLFWHPDRNDFWMFELDKRGAFVSKSPTYELLRRLPRIAGSADYEVTIPNTARTRPYEEAVAAAPPADEENDSAEEPDAVAAARGAGPKLPGEAPAAVPVVELRVANTGGQGARLRTGPSAAAESIAVLADGEVVRAVDQASVEAQRGWRQVRTEDGTVGWVAADLLAPAGE
jgi:hypothetical protein